MQSNVARGMVRVGDPKTRSVLLLRDLAAVSREVSLSGAGSRSRRMGAPDGVRKRSYTLSS